MDIIQLHDLSAQTIIGTHPWERAIAQTIVLNLEIGTDFKTPAQSDDLAHTLDYDNIANHIITYLSTSSCQLIETLAETIAERLFNEYAMLWLKLTITKPGALEQAKAVSVTIERKPEQYKA